MGGVQGGLLWRRIEYYVKQVRALDDTSGLSVVGIDETRLRRGPQYITVVHDLAAKRLLFAIEGRDHQTVLDFVEDPKARTVATRQRCATSVKT